MNRPPVPSAARSPRGFTLIELMVGMVLALVVALAAGAIYITNQDSWNQGRTKILLQDDATRCAEGIARDIRASRRVDYAGGTLTCYTPQGGVIRTYSRNAGTEEILRSGVSMTDFACTELLFSFNADSSAVDVSLELQDKFENRVRVVGTSNRRNWNHIDP